MYFYYPDFLTRALNVLDRDPQYSALYPHILPDQGIYPLAREGFPGGRDAPLPPASHRTASLPGRPVSVLATQQSHPVRAVPGTLLALTIRIARSQAHNKVKGSQAPRTCSSVVGVPVVTPGNSNPGSHPATF